MSVTINKSFRGALVLESGAPPSTWLDSVSCCLMTLPPSLESPVVRFPTDRVADSYLYTMSSGFLEPGSSYMLSICTAGETGLLRLSSSWTIGYFSRFVAIVFLR